MDSSMTATSTHPITWCWLPMHMGGCSVSAARVLVGGCRLQAEKVMQQPRTIKAEGLAVVEVVSHCVRPLCKRA